MALGDNSQCPSTQVSIDADCDFQPDFVDDHVKATSGAPSARQPVCIRGRSNTARSIPNSYQSQAAPLHKVRGPNWTEAEMLVLIGQKRIEWNGKHNCNQPSLAKFVYGTTAWKLVLAGCMGVVGFRARDTDQITNKWVGLIKDYIKGTGSANWWGMNREEKKQLSKTHKMSLKFSEAMYAEMEGFVGKRQIFGRATDIVDTNRLAPLVARHFGRWTPVSRELSFVGLESPAPSTTTASESPQAGTPDNDTPGSTGRKRKAVGTDNLVDFVKDFDHEYLACVEAQDIDKRAWRTDVLAFDTAREARLTDKENQAADMDHKFYELEVERTRNLGNMTTVLFMLASSMDTLTRYAIAHTSPILRFLLTTLAYSHGFLCDVHFEPKPSSPKYPPLPWNLPIELSPR